MVRIDGANDIHFYATPEFILSLSVGASVSARDETVEYYLNVSTANGKVVSIHCESREAAHAEMDRIAGLLGARA